MINITEERAYEILTNALPAVNVGKIREILFAFAQETKKADIKSGRKIQTISISELLLSSKTYHILLKVNINTVEELCSYSSKELRRFRGIGEHAIEEIEMALSIVGGTLKPHSTCQLKKGSE